MVQILQLIRWFIIFCRRGPDTNFHYMTGGKKVWRVRDYTEINLSMITVV